MPLRSAGLTLKASPALKCGHRTGGNPLLAGLTLKETKFRLALLGGRSSPDGGGAVGTGLASLGVFFLFFFPLRFARRA